MLYCMIARFDCNCNKRRLLLLLSICEMSVEVNSEASHVNACVSVGVDPQQSRLRSQCEPCNCRFCGVFVISLLQRSAY